MSAHLRQKFQQRKLGLLSGGTLLPPGSAAAAGTKPAAAGAAATGAAAAAADSVGGFVEGGVAAAPLQYGQQQQVPLPGGRAPTVVDGSLSRGNSSSSSISPSRVGDGRMPSSAEQWWPPGGERIHLYRVPDAVAAAQQQQQGPLEATDGVYSGESRSAMGSLKQQQEQEHGQLAVARGGGGGAAAAAESGEAGYSSSSSSAAAAVLPFSRGGHRLKRGGTAAVRARAAAASGDRYAVESRERHNLHHAAAAGFPSEEQPYESPWPQHEQQQQRRYLQQQQQQVLGFPPAAAAAYDSGTSQYGDLTYYNAESAAAAAEERAKVEASAWRGSYLALLPPSGLPLQHVSLLLIPAAAAAPTTLENLFPYVLRALLQHPTVIPQLLQQAHRKQGEAAGAVGETQLLRRVSEAVTSQLVEDVACSVELHSLRQQVKQLLPRGSKAAAAAPLAVQKLLRPDNLLAILQFAAAKPEPPPHSSSSGRKASLGTLEELPYALLEMSAGLPGATTATVTRLYPLRICAVLYAWWQEQQQQKQREQQTKKQQQGEATAAAAAPAADSVPPFSDPTSDGAQRAAAGGGIEAASGSAAAPAAAAAAGARAPAHALPSTGSCFMPGTPAAAAPSVYPPPPPPEPPFAQQQQQPFGFRAPQLHAGAAAGGNPPPGAPGGLRPPPPPPPAPPPPGTDSAGGGRGGLSDACGSSSKSAAETRKWEEGLEELLSAPTALKQRGLSCGTELSSLLNAPTARQQMVLLSFKNKNGSALREICPSGTRADCCRSRHSFVPCKKVHFRRIILPHTDVSLGDCSYLDTCRHIETCKYVHYEVDDASTSEVLKKRREASADPYAIGAISAGTYEEFPAQWIRCDIRTFDFSIFRRLIRVVMADPPWDIHMDLPYGTMTDQEMRSLRVDLIQEEGLLFLWVTGRAMEVARECLELWGYRRVEEILWVKTNQLQRIIRTGRTGHWLNHSKEHCLVGIKGENFSLNRNIDCDVIVSEVRETSRKPDEIYRIIERMCPDTLKVELFGRMHNVRNNWITLGNQLKGVKLEHPLLIERYNAFAPTVGLPLATLSEAASATAGSSTAPSVAAGTDLAEGSGESSCNSNNDAAAPLAGVAAEVGDTEVEESPPPAV